LSDTQVIDPAAAPHHGQRRRRARFMRLRGSDLGKDLARILFEERSRRSYGVTGYLISGGGAGAVTCWFQLGSLFGFHAPELVLHMLLIASGLFLLAVVLGFVAALAGYKTFEEAMLLPDEAINRPDNNADRWVAATATARAIAAVLIALGGLITFSAYAILAWR
jgi:hypothetical protein